MRTTLGLVLLVALTLAGCSGQVAPVQVTPTKPSAMEIGKSLLEQVAETGEIGSGLDEFKMALEELKQTDAAKAQELLDGVAKLESAGGGDAAKAQAKALMEKLK
jgi:hypothetical protein